jgi:hypothetical protein
MSRDVKETYYPLQLGRCSNCGLVQMMEVVPDYEIYDVEYGFFSGGSAAQRAYHARGASLLLQRFPDQAKRLTIEVACNDGSLLQHFKAAKCPTLGIDPADGPVDVAREQHGLDVINERMTTPLGQEIRRDYGPAGLIIAYNSMAHVENLTDVLTGIRTLMDNKTIAVFEVQYLPDLLIGNMYDQVYHEHRFFYSLTSMQHALQLHGLYVIDAELIELQGGGLRVTLSADPTVIPDPQVQRIINSEKWLLNLGVFDGFQGQVDRTRDHLMSLLDDECTRDVKIAGYGASAKATTIMNFCVIDSTYLDYVIDTTPYKQGRYVPGTGVKIISPEEAALDPADTLLLLVANYLGAVLRANVHSGRWIVPQPLPAVI